MGKDFKVSCHRCGNWIDLNKYDDRFNFCGEVLACKHCGCPYLLLAEQSIENFSK